MITRLDRTTQEFRNAKNHVYGLAHNVCFSGREQTALISEMQDAELEMIKDGMDGKTIILQLLGIIVDGIRYGNWPWIKNGINTLESKS